MGLDLSAYGGGGGPGRHGAGVVDAGKASALGYRFDNGAIGVGKLRRRVDSSTGYGFSGSGAKLALDLVSVLELTSAALAGGGGGYLPGHGYGWPDSTPAYPYSGAGDCWHFDGPL